MQHNKTFIESLYHLKPEVGTICITVVFIISEITQVPSMPDGF